MSFDIDPVCDADVILIDESHNFRNRTTQRYEKPGTHHRTPTAGEERTGVERSSSC